MHGKVSYVAMEMDYRSSSLMWISAGGGSKVAAYLHTNVVSYKDNVALFQQAEKEFGGVDVREGNHFARIDTHIHITFRLYT